MTHASALRVQAQHGAPSGMTFLRLNGLERFSRPAVFVFDGQQKTV